MNGDRLKEEMMENIFEKILRKVAHKGISGFGRTSCLFNDQIMAALFPLNFKMPNIAFYEGKVTMLTM